VGAVVQGPAAALRAADVLDGLSFAVIAVDDLARHTFAADRAVGELADLLDPWQPALLDLVALVAKAGLDLGTPVGACGSAAADPLLALVLTGLGVTSLSMAPRAVADVREALAARTLDECRVLAELALAATTPEGARAAVEGALD
jgi:phosphotransferase system enzyme I (PtsI)